MFAPFGPRPAAEWIEVCNLSAWPKRLNGLSIVDGEMNVHEIASPDPIVAEPGAYVLLVRDRATAIANGLAPTAIAYEYGADLSSTEGIILADGPSGAVSLWSDGGEIAAAPYGSWGLVAFGQSVELGVLQVIGSDTAAPWCYGEYPWAPGSDFGTPGAPNDCPR
jgi:hypothetical protein